MTFINEVISLSQLPKYEEVPLVPIERKYKVVVLWNCFFTFLLLLAIAILFFLVEGWSPWKWIAVAASVLISTGLTVLQLKAFERKSYAIRDHDILYRHGILSVTMTVIPFNRIQHVAVNEGIISRIYKLASIQVFTAGGNSADLKISGLKKEVAQQLREVILTKISI